MSGERLRRHLHPGAWWLWAAGLSVAAIRTTNPLLLCLIIAVSAYVVMARRSDAPWARSYGAFLRIGLTVILFRIVLQLVFGTRLPGHVILTLPEAELPDWAAGIRVGGAVTVEGLVDALYNALRLAAVIASFGAANALASPYRLLRCLPGALYEAAVAVTVAMSFAPQAVMSAAEIREARRLRGRPTLGIAGLRGLAVPVLEGALRRSLDLAASMDSRGYGRRRAVPPALARLTSAATAAGLLVTCAGMYGVLDGGAPAILGLPTLATGSLLLVVGLAAGSRRTERTRYRPDPWRFAEWFVTLCGVLPVAALVAVGRLDPLALEPSTFPLEVPAVPLLAVLGLLVALAPAIVAPLPPRSVPRPVAMPEAVAA